MEAVKSDVQSLTYFTCDSHFLAWFLPHEKSIYMNFTWNFLVKSLHMNFRWPFSRGRRIIAWFRSVYHYDWIRISVTAILSVLYVSFEKCFRKSKINLFVQFPTNMFKVCMCNQWNINLSPLNGFFLLTRTSCMCFVFVCSEQNNYYFNFITSNQIFLSSKRGRFCWYNQVQLYY